ncbi:MAG: transporter substrate-binding domain-containing protein [Marinobacter sp.]|uniref:substrate-binding periplasmic protein n=1 Tax=Marinobacter sp. TaxID=50741 RepID=UPI00299D4BFA|nr:transporter substrate-binding domain-containing protein [Marinobacter sp.]MDX1756080.1 transporter substrate-binding domain-containing protein [Marinobacter sp.]
MAKLNWLLLSGVLSLFTWQVTGAMPNSQSDGDDAIPTKLTAALAEADYPPFYFVDDGRLQGISIEVLERIAERLNLEVSYRRLSWPRVLQSLQDGQVDMVTTFSNTAERAPSVVYAGVPHAVENNHLFSRAGDDISFHGQLEDLAAYRIGAIRGYTYGEAFDSADYLLKESVLDEPTLVRMVMGGRFDVAVGNPFAIRRAAGEEQRAAALQFMDPPVNRSPIYMAFSRRNPAALELAARFTTTLVEFKQTPAYRQLLDKYGLTVSEMGE